MFVIACGLRKPHPSVLLCVCSAHVIDCNFISWYKILSRAELEMFDV